MGWDDQIFVHLFRVSHCPRVVQNRKFGSHKLIVFGKIRVPCNMVECCAHMSKAFEEGCTLSVENTIVGVGTIPNLRMAVRPKHQLGNEAVAQDAGSDVMLLMQTRSSHAMSACVFVKSLPFGAFPS